MELPPPPEPNKLQKWLWKNRWLKRRFKEKLRCYLWNKKGWSGIFMGEECDLDSFLEIYSKWFEQDEDKWFSGNYSWFDLIQRFEKLVIGVVKCPVCGEKKKMWVL